MESLDEATGAIYDELLSDDSEVRAEYLKHFSEEVRTFSAAMARAVVVWRQIDSLITGNERKAYVSALAHAAIALHVVSFKLFLSGHIIPAGNTLRQVLESVSLALLCSSRGSPVLTQFMNDRYSTKNAVRDVVRNWKELGLIEGTHEQLQKSQEFYHQYSHMSRVTIGVLMSFSQTGGVYTGASFDGAKLFAYRKEVSGRVSLAEIFDNILAAVKANLHKW